ncbi:MAG TPA: M48 family metallopeptidase [Candidatus Acidoferrales bacterium]|nr:M48 family metallopeptidase [Candidatus Acidoferrales bacterium]
MKPSSKLLTARAITLALSLLSLASVGLSDDRTVLRPGFNLFSPQQDIQLGLKASAQVPHQFVLLNNKRVDDYLQQLGLRLAAHAPGYKYPYQYRCVNSEILNAFALPGGYIYINRGVIENADDEAQLAAVMAHETSHVALRHGTNQATKAYAAQAGLSILGALVGGSDTASLMAQLFSGGVVPLVFLKMSRTDESQADILGTQILHDAGYDPYAMGQFFKKIEAADKNQSVEFLSDHPSPENRVGRADEEANRLSALHNPRKDSPEFESIKRYVKSLPPPPKQPRPAAVSSSAPANAPEAPSGNYVAYSSSDFSLMRPDNWQAHAQDGGVQLAPGRGEVKDAQGNPALAYGVIVGVFAPQNVSGAAPSLEQATDQLIASIRQSNPKMSVMRVGDSTTLSGQPARSTYLQSDSPAGGREADWLITTLRPSGLFYIICVSPQTAFEDYDSAFRSVVHSVRFTN